MILINLILNNYNYNMNKLNFKSYFLEQNNNSKVTSMQVMEIINKYKNNSNWKYHTASGNCGTFAISIYGILNNSNLVYYIFTPDEEIDDEPTIYHISLGNLSDNVNNIKFIDGWGEHNINNINKFCLDIYNNNSLYIHYFSKSNQTIDNIISNTNWYVSVQNWNYFFDYYINLPDEKSKNIFFNNFMRKIAKWEKSNNE